MKGRKVSAPAGDNQQTFQLKQIEAFHKPSQTPVGNRRWEGLALTEQQQEYMLPHFNMIIIGKPGSGKTAAIKKLVQDRKFYFQQFDTILIMSPSATKMGIAVPKANASKVLDLPWLYEHFAKINAKQYQKMRGYVQPMLKKMQPILDQDFIKDKAGIGVDMKNGKSMTMIPTKIKQFDAEQKFFTTQVLATIGGAGKLVYGAQIKGMFEQEDGKKRGRKGKQKIESEASKRNPEMFDSEWIEQNIVKKLTPEQQQKTHTNVLVVMDDVIGDIKRHENDTELAQLFFNRRHLIANGTISTMVVSQKYTMIPARIRSAASWLILFRLNPNDFETVYNDVIMMSRERWSQLLYFVYDHEGEMNEDARGKKYDNMGIWVEYDKFFKNFEPIVSNRLV